jgi:glycine hydroxymethyltransferase
MATRPRKEATLLKLDEARTRIKKMSPSEITQYLVSLVKGDENWRGRTCINLLAPENLMSPTARRILSSGLSERTAEGEIGDRWFSGLKYIDEIEALAVELAKALFKCRYADHRLVSGMVGNMTVYFALTKPGDMVMSMREPDGGHVSNRDEGCAGCRGLRTVDIPFDPYEMNLDVKAFSELALEVKPSARACAYGLSREDSGWSPKRSDCLER